MAGWVVGWMNECIKQRVTSNEQRVTNNNLRKSAKSADEWIKQRVTCNEQRAKSRGQGRWDGGVWMRPNSMFLPTDHGPKY
jgi:hypothetical protein